MKGTIKTLVASVLLTLAAGVAVAETNDLKEGRSSRDIMVNAFIPKMSGLTQPGNIDLGKFDGSKDLEATTNFCMYSNIREDVKLSVKGAYAFTGGDAVEGYKSKKGFAMSAGKKGKHEELPFRVIYVDSKGKGNSYPLSHGEEISAPGAKWVQQCRNSGKGSQLKVLVKKSDAENVYEGSYSAILTLTVSPE